MKQYLFWDTERIKNTKIYLSAYILTDSSFNIVEQKLFVDTSIDVSKRHDPKRKVNQLSPLAIKVNSVLEYEKIMRPLLTSCTVVCFGKDDFVSLNDQLKIFGSEPILGRFINIAEFVIKNTNDLPRNLGSVAEFLNVKHDPHNPLSDSYVTMEYFKFLLTKYDEECLSYEIPNVNKVLDVALNPSKKELK